MVGPWFKSEQLDSEDITFYKLDVKRGCVAFMESTLSIEGSFLYFMTLFLGLWGEFVKLWEWGQKWLSCTLELIENWNYSVLVLTTFKWIFRTSWQIFRHGSEGEM